MPGYIQTGIYSGPVPKILFNATDEQKERWSVAAGSEKVSLSEWIRRACEERAPLTAGEASAADGSDSAAVTAERDGASDKTAPVPPPAVSGGKRSYEPRFKQTKKGRNA